MEHSGGSERVEESLSTALGWIGAHLHMFGLGFWRRDADRNAFPYGPLVELLQVLNGVPDCILSNSVNIDNVVSFSRRELTELRAGGSRSAFVHIGWLELDSLARKFGVPDRTQDVEDRDSHIEMPGAFLDDLYVMETVGDPSRAGDYDAALMRSGLGPRSSGRTITRADAYFLTHLVFYATRFGRRANTLSSENTAWLARALSAIAASAEVQSNLDLLAECEASRALLEPGRPSNPFREHLAETVNARGFLPANAAMANSISQLSRDEVFRGSYHATLAFILMGSATSRPWNLAAPA